MQSALWREAFHLVETGAATVADIDVAITQGIGLRWAVVGPFMGFQLSGGEGGIEHVLDHLGPHIETWWHDLGTPSLTPELRKKVIDGTAQMMANRDVADVERRRDTLLMRLLALKSAIGR